MTKAHVVFQNKFMVFAQVMTSRVPFEIVFYFQKIKIMMFNLCIAMVESFQIVKMSHYLREYVFR